MNLEQMKTEAYRRALKAEPRLRAIEKVVRMSAGQCQGCAWEQIIKPLALPYVGADRGVPLRQARDPRPDGGWRVQALTVADLEAMNFPDAPDAETETEEWLRSAEAYEAVTRVWLEFLWDADSAGGCQLRFPEPVFTPSGTGNPYSA